MLVLNNDFDIPAMTAKIAHAAFPKGNPYLLLRDQLGTISEDSDFADLYSNTGQPAFGIPPFQWLFRKVRADRR